MPRKAREILKSRGYTDEELNGLPLLADPRFVAALESEDAEREALASERDQLKRTVDDTGRWYHETAKPTLERALADATNARAEKARLEARLQAETDYGLRQVADAQDRGGAGAGNANDGRDRSDAARNGNDAGARAPDLDSRYIDRDTFTSATQQFGDAIGMATDIIENHRELFGQRLPGGMNKLRAEYRDAVRINHFSGNLEDFWRQKYDVGKRESEIAAKAKADQEAQIRQDERSKVMSEFANPNTRPLEGSRNPFVRKPAAGEGGNGSNVGRQPWERGNPEQVRNARVVRMATKVLQGNQAG